MQEAVDKTPVIIVEPHPDNADDNVGHQDRREPHDPKEAAERRAGEEAKGKDQAASNIADGTDDGEDRGVADRLPTVLHSSQAPPSMAGNCMMPSGKSTA